MREAWSGAVGGRGTRAPLGRERVGREAWERAAQGTRARTAGAARGRLMGALEAGRIADEG